MPIYEYQCQACGHTFDKLQKVSDAPLTDCPACGKSALQKLVSAAGFQLKGSGWYVTDFRDNGKKPDAQQNQTTKTDAKPEPKSEPKSATKADTKKD